MKQKKLVVIIVIITMLLTLFLTKQSIVSADGEGYYIGEPLNVRYVRSEADPYPHKNYIYPPSNTIIYGFIYVVNEKLNGLTTGYDVNLNGEWGTEKTGELPIITMKFESENPMPESEKTKIINEAHAMGIVSNNETIGGAWAIKAYSYLEIRTYIYGPGQGIDFTIYPIYYGIPPMPTPTPTAISTATATAIPWGEQEGCAILPEETPITAYDLEWLAMCSDCIPEATATPGVTELNNNYRLPSFTLHDYGGEISGTVQPTETTVAVPGMCSTPPALRNDTPVMDIPTFITTLDQITPECTEYIPAVNVTIPAFMGLWNEFSIGWDGWELCVKKITVPNMRVLDLTIPAASVLVSLVVMLYRRMAN